MPTIRTGDGMSSGSRISVDVPPGGDIAYEGIIIAGGLDSSVVQTDRVFKYNPSDDSWTELSSLNQARQESAMATLGKYSVIHGGSIGGTPEPKPLIYNAEDDSWTATSSQGATDLTQPSAYADSDAERMFFVEDVHEGYSQSDDDWADRAVPGVKTHGAGAAILENEFYNICGQKTSDDSYTRAVQKFDLDNPSGGWTSLNDFPQDEADGSATVSDGTLYFFSTFSSDDIWKYDKANDSWTKTGDSLNFPLRQSKAISPDGTKKIYIPGGYDGSNIRKTLQIYDPSDGSVTTGADIPMAVADYGVSRFNLNA